MNLQKSLQGVLPENWMTQIGVLPNFAIDDEFKSKDTELKQQFKKATTAEERENILRLQQNLAQKQKQWLQYSQG